MTTPQETFIQEARDLLHTLEETLLELEDAPKNSDLIDAAFRALHTLKGSGDMFGFAELARFIHHFEDAFDQIREGKAVVTPDLIAVALDSRDHLAGLLDLGADTSAPPPMKAAGEGLIDRLNKLRRASPVADTPTTDAPEPVTDEEVLRLWQISFSAEPAALKNGFRPEALWSELADLGKLNIRQTFDRIPPLDAFDPAECYVDWVFDLETTATRAQIDDVFLFFIDAHIEITDQTETPPEPDTLDEPGPPAPSDPLPSIVEDAVKTAPKSDTVRVQANRLDDLMDQLGELVIAQARLRSIADEINEPRLDTTVEEIEALVTGLRDTTLSIRMLPVSMVFGKFRRVVRDLSVELGKPATLITEGGETEVDKNIIDSLTEPLVHMIRNSVDHGVEDVKTRKAAGKPEAATVRLSARQSGGEVLISISDDGGGLNTQAIRNRALDRGLISEDQNLSNDALHQLIFEPGFSTAETLSAVSGRGVGMDAVRRVVIDDLRGSIDVKSAPGKGTEVILRLPLTLAIIDGLLVQIDGDPFVLPLSSVEECVDLPSTENTRDSGRSILHIRDQLVPYLNLDTLFSYPPSDLPNRRVAIVNAEGQRIGLVVDDVLGQLQTVIKPLSIYHRGVEEIAGATILGDGGVALILDVNAIVRNADTQPGLAA